MKLTKALLLGTATLALSQAASAATFDFTGGSSVVTSGGITVTASAPGETLTTGGSGFGVKSNCCDLNGIQNNETLRLDFSAAADIGTLFLKGWEGPDRLTLAWDGGSLDINDDNNFWSSDEYYDINLSGVTFLTLTGNSFGTVTTLAGLQDVNLTPSEVPVPAAAWLFGTALVGLGSLKKRRT